MTQEIDWEVTVADGKYTLQHFKNGGGKALRYGEEWPARNCIGDNMIFALGVDLLECRRCNKLLKEMMSEFYQDSENTKLLAKYHDMLTKI